MSKTYREITICKKHNNLRATITQMDRKKHTDLSKQRINQLSGNKIIVISQSYNEIASSKTADNILATKIQMKRNNL